MPAKLTQKDVIDRFNSIWDGKYGYSLVEYINSYTKVKIICPVHGEFEQTPRSHFQQGCNKCGIVNRSDKRRKPIEIFKQNATIKHNNKYCYDLVIYKNNNTKVKIICPIHGIFEQKPYNHLRGDGCPGCGGRIKHTKETFKILANIKHNGIYDYSLVRYKNNKTLVDIICPIHGLFKQNPNNHLNGQRCPECAKLRSNQEESFVTYIKTIYDGKMLINNRSIIPPYELDVFLPDKLLAFEYNGTYWHNEGITKPIGYHQMKTDMCSGSGIKLIHIWEKEWVDSNTTTKEFIKGLI